MKPDYFKLRTYRLLKIKKNPEDFILLYNKNIAVFDLQFNPTQVYL